MESTPQFIRNQRYLFCVGFLIILAIYGCHQKKQTKNTLLTNITQLQNNPPTLSVNIGHITKNNQLKGAGMVHVKYDANFNKSKNYIGYSFSRLLDSVIRAMKFDTSNYVVVFECTDGYKPVLDLQKIHGHAKPYLVYRDMDVKGSKLWPDSIGKKFSPYCLVWDDIKSNDHSYPWPYGIISFDLISVKNEYSNIFPVNENKMVSAFYLFRDNCMKCHSMNKTGGNMGPEFNFPKNITEYWTEDNIIAYVQNPQSFRYNSHMPAITALTKDQIKQIIGYIKYMRSKKIKS